MKQKQVEDKISMQRRWADPLLKRERAGALRRGEKGKKTCDRDGK